MPSSLRTRLENSHPASFTIYATIAAFCEYMCMYAFRKPLHRSNLLLWSHNLGLDYKSTLVIVQVLGYMLSKFIGVKVISEMNPDKRATAILILIGIAELALLGFATVEPPYNAIFLFMNGLPLGMIWGLVFSFLEGRKQTEIMGTRPLCEFCVCLGFGERYWEIPDGQRDLRILDALLCRSYFCYSAGRIYLAFGSASPS